jgi:hypothetical protein
MLEASVVDGDLASLKESEKNSSNLTSEQNDAIESSVNDLIEDAANQDMSGGISDDVLIALDLDHIVQNETQHPQQQQPTGDEQQPKTKKQRGEDESEKDGFELDGYAFKRWALREFFYHHVTKQRKWPIVKQMPRKGRDKDFDHFLWNLGLSDNRTYASTHWREYKKNRGIYPPPGFEKDPVKLLAMYQCRIPKRWGVTALGR